MARRSLAGVVVLGALGSLLLLAQAWAVTGLVLAGLRAGAGRPTGAVLGWSVAVAALFLARAAVGWCSDVLAARAGALVVADVRSRVMRAALAGVPGSTGSLAALATRGAAAVEPYLTRYVPAFVLAGVLPALVVVAIALVDPMSAVVVIATLPLIPVFGILVGLATRDRATLQWRAMSDLSGHFLDVMRGLPTLVAFRRARAQTAVIRAVTDRYRRLTMETLRIAFASSAVLELVATISVALVAVSVGLRLQAGDLSLRTAFVVLLLAPEAYWPLRRVGAEFHAASEGVATFEAAAALDDLQDDIPPVLAGHGSVVLDGVSVTYPGRAAPALAATTLRIPASGITAVTGPSGCGKSTLLSVVAGLVAPSAGTVVRPETVAWVGQRPTFVPGTIADNLRLAAPEATEGELWAALRQVAMEERVRHCGLDAELGDEGRTLSAGERARLALARVLLSDRHWVLLDEPTAHLDELTEQIIADTIVELGRTRAVLLVAHRPALVALADRVVELETAQWSSSERSERPSRPARPSGAERVMPPSVAEQRAELASVEAGTRTTAGLWGAALLGGLASSFGVALTATAGWLLVRASYHPAVLTLLVAIVGVRFFGIGRPVLRYVERLRSHDVALRLLSRRRAAVYDAIVPLTPGRLGRHRGDVLASIVDDVDAVVDRELRVRLPVRGFVVTAVLATAVTTLLAPVAGLVVGVCCVGGGGGAFLIAAVGAARSERAMVAARAEVSQQVTAALQAADELRIWGAVDDAVAHIARASREPGRASSVSAWWLGSARGLALVVAGIGVAAVAVAMAGVGQVSGSVLALLVLVPLALAEPMSSMAEAGGLTARVAAAESRLRALESMPPAVTDPESPVAARADTTVTAEGVVAAWDEHVVLDGLDLGVAPGERVAIVGPSGSGKSTIAALLLRFVDPVGGEIGLGSVPTGRLALDDVRRRVGLVDDDPHVFASTVVENVRFARPGAADEEVERALRRAHLGAWLDSLPEGLATRLGDGYAAVSGGERARLAIARSLLAEQPVLVLDEPTAHLDSATAEAIAEEVLDSYDLRSVVWITHGTAGLDRVDKVVRL